MMNYFEVRIDQEKCIGCMSCVAVCPEVFDIDENKQKAIIKEKYRKSSQELTIGIVPSSILDCIKDAVETCPVSVITMIELKEEQDLE